MCGGDALSFLSSEGLEGGRVGDHLNRTSLRVQLLVDHFFKLVEFGFLFDVVLRLVASDLILL